MDDFSRLILDWELKSDMAAGSLVDVFQKAVDATGMTDVPVEDRIVLLSDNGPGYLSRQFGEYLRLVGIRHILASPFHPQINGKIERYHRTMKGGINLLPYEMPDEMEEASGHSSNTTTTAAITRASATSPLMTSIQVGITRSCNEERRRRPRHYRREEATIAPSGSRAQGTDVLRYQRSPSVPLLQTTYSLTEGVWLLPGLGHSPESRGRSLVANGRKL